MRKENFRRTFLALSVAAGLISTCAYAQTQGTEPIDTTGSPSSSTRQSGLNTQGSTSGTINSGAHDQAINATDRELNSRIREAFNRDSTLHEATSSVILHSNNGVVTLNGTVATEKEKKDLESQLRRIAGVNQVENELQIAPRPSDLNTGSATQSR